MTEGPDRVEVQNERIIAEPFDMVWDRLVGELAKSFFVINNIEKESRLINLSFQVSDPETYIDCGRSTRTYKAEIFEYEVAEDSQYLTAKQLDNNNYADYIVNRNTALEGRMNVYVAPDGNEATRVSVNCRYIFSVDVTGNYQTFGGVLKIAGAAGTLDPQHYSVSLSTGPPTTDSWGAAGEEITCGSNGALENSVLDLAE